MLKLLPSRLHVITSGRASTKAVVKGGGGGGGRGREHCYMWTNRGMHCCEL